MRSFIAVFGGALALSATIGMTAYAQEQAEGYLAQHLRAPSNALELKLGAGYTQGFGRLSPSRMLPDVAGAGLGASVDVDYRLAPHWSLGIEGQYQEFANGQNTAARGLAGNLGATYHFNPVVRGDPWLRLGSGYRFLWENNPSGAQDVVLRHGFELVAGQLGYDVRVSEDVALAPVVGADLNLFVWQDPTDAPARSMSSAQVGTFIYAGLQGRFDIAGSREGVETTAQPRVIPRPVGLTAPQPQTPIAAPPPAPPPVEEAKQETEPVSPSLAVSEELMRVCQLHIGTIEKAPKFEFDKSNLQPADIGVLKQVAECFTTGPMKDARMHLVGRADPRGTVKYNDALGMRRANEVAAFLEQLGIATDNITVTSRGERDARGHDEASWAIDRRVDILQAP